MGWRSSTLIGVVVLLAVGCAPVRPPVRTTGAYEHKATSTADTAASAVETALLVVTAAGEEKVFGPYAAVVLDESESTASGAQSTFDGIQPPATLATDQLRNTLDGLLDRAVDSLTTVRIEARRGHLHRTLEERAELRRIADELAAFSERHQ